MKPVARFLSIVIATVITYQSALIAPAINIALPIEPAATMLRFIWPIFFALVGIMGLIGVVVARKQRQGFIVNLATLVGMAACFIFVPIINNAKDTDTMILWNVLHTVTVGITFVILVLHLIYIFRWHRKGYQNLG
ncbi:MAG: hypothetical protein AAFY98_05570 [Verrucomicrobiota bacterium]